MMSRQKKLNRSMCLGGRKTRHSVQWMSTPHKGAFKELYVYEGNCVFVGPNKFKISQTQYQLIRKEIRKRLEIQKKVARCQLENQPYPDNRSPLLIIFSLPCGKPFYYLTICFVWPEKKATISPSQIYLSIGRNLRFCE